MYPASPNASHSSDESETARSFPISSGGILQLKMNPTDRVEIENINDWTNRPATLVVLQRHTQCTGECERDRSIPPVEVVQRADACKTRTYQTYSPYSYDNQNMSMRGYY